jgi:hypothetical protein
VPEEYRARARKIVQSGEMISYETRTREEFPPARADRVQTKDQNGRDEQWWRGQVQNIRTQIAKEEDNLAFYDTRQRECEEEQKNHLRYWRNCSRLNEEARKRAEWNIGKLKTRLEVELPEEARKAGAMPGWLRE